MIVVFAMMILVIGSGSSPVVAQTAFIVDDVRLGDMGTSYLNIEFSPDMRYLTFIDGRTRQTWLAGIDPQTATLIPADGKGFLIGETSATSLGFTQWGINSNGQFAIALNADGQLMIIHPESPTSAQITILPTPANRSRALPYASRLPDQEHIYIIYEQMDRARRMQLWVLDTATPTVERQITFGNSARREELPNLPPFVATIQRWFYDAETLMEGLPIFTYGSIDATTGALVVQQIDLSVSDAPPQALTDPAFSFFDAFPTVIGGERYLLSGIDFDALGGLYRQAVGNNVYTEQVQRLAPTGSTLAEPAFLSSIEPFVWAGEAYASFQMSDGADTTRAAGEIWLASLFDDDLLVRVSSDVPALRSDPEFYIGTESVWIFYLSRPLGDQPRAYELRRAATGL